MTQLLSIVMPAYNASDYIAEAIGSVLDQTYSDWELVVVDDCSTDNTCDIVKDIAAHDRRLRLVERASNSGSAFMPRLEAVKRANGNYVVELDSDDRLEHDYLQKIAGKIEETGADAVFGNTVFIYPDGHQSALLTEFDRNAVVKGRTHVRHTLDGWSDGCWGAIRRSLYLEAAKHPDLNRLAMSADEFLIRAILTMAGSVAFFESTYYYRIHPLSITRREHPRIFDVIDTDIRLKRLIYSIYPPKSEERKLINRQLTANLWAYLRTYSTFAFTSESDRKKAYQLIKDAYSNADIAGARQRIGTLRTCAMMLGVDSVITMHKLLASLGKRQQLQKHP